jgi:hypothetical protein
MSIEDLKKPQSVVQFAIGLRDHLLNEARGVRGIADNIRSISSNDAFDPDIARHEILAEAFEELARAVAKVALLEEKD